MEGIIRTRDLTRRFDALTAVDHLNLEIPRGEIFGLVGPDGAGKTTTLRMLCGLLDPTEGEAWVAGHDVVRDTQAVKDCIGYMAQRFGLYVDLTVDENMELSLPMRATSSGDTSSRCASPSRPRFTPPAARAASIASIAVRAARSPIT